MMIIKIILLTIISYLIGSIPFSYILCKRIKKIDIRTVGSKNVGATNAGRILGKKWFFIITLMDIFKGFIVIYIIQYLMAEQILSRHASLYITAGLCAILGHSFSPFLNFKGGKGVAVSAGVLIAIDFRLILICIPVFILTVLISKYISLGSIIGSISIPVSIMIFHYRTRDFFDLFSFGLLISLYVIYKHKTNIKRLLSGTERKWGEKIET